MFVVKFYVGWEESKREKKERREKRRVGGEVGHVSVRVFFVRYYCTVNSEIARVWVTTD